MTSKRWVCAIIMMMTLATLLSACGPGGNDDKTIKVFANSGQTSEKTALDASIKAFEKQTGLTVTVQYLSEDNYKEQITSAASSHKLPCVMAVNGPSVYNYAWSQYLVSIDKYITDDLRSDLLPSIITQGKYNNHQYILGQYDAGLGLYANKKYLTDAGVRIPTFDKPWTLDEFNDALARLKKLPGVQYPMGMMMNYTAMEWFNFSVSPLLQSFGGDLINRNGYQSSDGVLNGPESVAAMTWYQGLFNQKYVNPKPADDNGFPTGKYALNWSGHWMYDTYKKGLGDDLVLLPAPNLGKGAKTGMGSWGWGMTNTCKNPDDAWKLIDFLLSPDQVKAMTKANSAVPARKSVSKDFPLYADGGPLQIFVQQLNDSNIATPRPATPAFDTISTAFSKAVLDISTGTDVKSTLDKATQTIDDDIKRNQGYPAK